MCGSENKCGCDSHGSESSCHSYSLKLGGFLVPCILLLLKEKPAHGYELIEKLNKLSLLEAISDPAVIYRHLRRLEEEGIVVSHLEEGSGGPARKVYSLTAEGESYLKGWASVIQNRKSALENFLLLYEKCFSSESN